MLACLAATKAGGIHEFWPADISVTNERHFDRSRMRGHQQVTDLYLLALAIAHGGRLVTFDQGIAIAAIPGATEANLITITAIQP